MIEIFERATRRRVAILENADAEFEEGKLYAIVGPSGSGRRPR